MGAKTLRIQDYQKSNKANLVESLKAKISWLESENLKLRGGGRVISMSPSIKALVSELEKISRSEATVLLNGEIGVGKSVLARTIHDYSPQALNSFVVVNCSEMSEKEAERILFGSLDADTGKLKNGLIHQADHGTLFLNEVTELGLDIQPKILEAIDKGIVRRVGGSKNETIKFRLIAATHRNLKQAVDEGKITQELFYRLNVLPIHIPPLRERKEDIPALIQHFVEKHANKFNIIVEEIEPEYFEILKNLNFVGNIRELGNLVERSLMHIEGRVLRAEHLLGDRDLIRGISDSPLQSLTKGPQRLQDALELFECSFIKSTLARNLDIDASAKELGVSRSTLYSKISKYKLK